MIVEHEIIPVAEPASRANRTQGSGSIVQRDASPGSPPAGSERPKESVRISFQPQRREDPWQ
jgi:hypothetical protein